jgi:CHAD domain-containing protein
VPHAIEKDEDIAAALLRVAAADLAMARTELSATCPPPACIHGIRQRLKRVRTLLRVFEAAPMTSARPVRRLLTALARTLAEARDADVAVASAREIAAATPRAAELGFDRVVAVLEREAFRAHRERIPLAEIDRQLGLLANELTALSEESFDGLALLNHGFERSYRRGRRWMRRSRSSLGTPELHGWRKSVKDLWHLLGLSSERIANKGQKLAPVLGRLGDVLGLDHDHAVLAEKLALSPRGDPALMAQLGLIADRRRALEAEAFELGDAIYGESPASFTRGLFLR